MDQLRQWYTNYEANLEQVRAFWSGEGHWIISVAATKDAYRQTFDDKTLLAKAPLNLRAQANLPGVNLPSFYPDWGTVSTAKYWGGVPRFDSTGGNIYTDPVAQTIDEALALRPHPLDDPSQDLAKAVRLYREISASLGTESLWLRSPDMQGPLNTAGLVINQETLMMAFHDEPRKAHAFLDQVTDFFIEYALYLRRETGNRVCGNIWPYTFFPSDLGVSFTEDLMPLVSTRIYKEFGLPILKKISSALGSLHIHCCGPFGHHVRTLADSDLDIAAIEFHHPETSIMELAPLAGRTVLIPYILLYEDSNFRSPAEYYRYLIDTYSSRHRFWFACADDSPEMIEFAREFMPEM